MWNAFCKLFTEIGSPKTECRRGGGLVLELCIASNSTDSKEGSMEGGLPVVKSFETDNKVRCSTARTRL